MYRQVLGRRAARIVAEVFTQPSHDLSYQHVTFAEATGGVVGMASGYTAEAHRNSTDRIRHTATGWRRYGWMAFNRLAARTLRFIDVVPEGDYYVRALAVDPSHRGTGVGTALFASLEGQARSCGSQRIALDVAAKNKKALRLYERLGMSAEAESQRWFYIPNTNLIRMTKPL